MWMKWNSWCTRLLAAMSEDPLCANLLEASTCTNAGRRYFDGPGHLHAHEQEVNIPPSSRPRVRRRRAGEEMALLAGGGRDKCRGRRRETTKSAGTAADQGVSLRRQQTNDRRRTDDVIDRLTNRPTTD